MVVAVNNSHGYFINHIAIITHPRKNPINQLTKPASVVPSKWLFEQVTSLQQEESFLQCSSSQAPCWCMHFIFLLLMPFSYSCCVYLSILFFFFFFFLTFLFPFLNIVHYEVVGFGNVSFFRWNFQKYSHNLRFHFLGSQGQQKYGTLELA